jgi:AcrR family transcriptional regulator
MAPEPSTPQVRDLLLDAAYDAAVTTGWPRTRMGDLAAAAGVSRQTLYDQFASKDGLALALALRETQRFLDGIDAAMSGRVDDPVECVDRAVRYALRSAAANPLLRGVLTGSGDAGLLPFLTTRAAPVIAAARERMGEFLGRHFAHLDAESTALAADATVRLTLSHMVVAEDEPPAAVAASITAVVRHLLDKTGSLM